MSSILKALKKLEDDKATRRPDELKIDAEILRTDNSPRISSTGVLLASVLLLAGGSGATYLLMRQDRAAEFVSQKSSSMSKQKIPSVSTSSEIKAEEPPAAIEVVPANQQKKVEAKQHPQRPVAIGTIIPTSKSLKPTEASKAVDAPPKTAKPALYLPANAVPTLRVNGIAFQNSSADSVAIVNGVQVSNGSIIEGIVVEEIKEDKILFQHNGVKFEIALGQSNK